MITNHCIYANTMVCYNLPKLNPNLTTGLVGKVRKKNISRRRKEGRVEKKSVRNAPAGPGTQTRTCRVLGEGPQLHAMGAV